MPRTALLHVWTAERLALLREVAQAAGQAILRVYERPTIASQSKADASPLTEADLAADALIREGLARHFPALPVISEESLPAPGSQVNQGFFLVDPLDGTREFLARNGQFTVNIAWVSEQGQPVAGVVHSPALAQTHWGALEVGAFVAKANPAESATSASSQAWQQWPQQRIQAAPPPAAGRAWRVLASRSHGNDAQAAWLDQLRPAPQVVLAGSSLKFCLLAEGLADVYPRLSPTAFWDTAAGQAVLEAAGGAVVQWRDQEAAIASSEPPPLRVSMAWAQAVAMQGPEAAQAPSALNPNFVAASSKALALACPLPSRRR